MARTRSTNDNEAITKLDVKSVFLPVLFPCSENERDGTAYATYIGGSRIGRPVRVVPAEALREAIHPAERQKFAATFGELPDTWRDVVLGDMRLADALEEDDNKEARNIIEKHLDEPSHSAILKTALSEPSEFLCSHLTNGLAGIQVVIWKHKGTGKLRAGLYCSKARQLVYALLVGWLGRSGSYSACQRCGNWFEKRRARHPYCSYKCRVAEAMKRYRANLKKRERGKSKSRKRGRTKQSVKG